MKRGELLEIYKMIEDADKLVNELSDENKVDTKMRIELLFA